MTDIFSRRKRSDIMSRIRSCHTKPEEQLFLLVKPLVKKRKILRNVKELPGHPDILIPSLRLVILCDGCFYHNCPKHGHIPKSNKEYWEPKLVKNALRDSLNRRKLRNAGYYVWKFWEHDLQGKRLANTRLRLKRRFGVVIKKKYV